jgi:hypothetical protein
MLAFRLRLAIGSRRPMNYWIFTAAPYSANGEFFTARQIYDRRMQDKFWGLGPSTRHRKNVRKADQVVFYVARPEQVFAGTAQLASDCFDVSREERSSLSHGTSFFAANHGVRLESIETWAKPHPMAPLAPTLQFVKNPTQWWTHLQGGIRQVSESDYAQIIGGIGLGERSSVRIAEDVESESLFALEAHLEEFIDHNWSKISWGAALEQYRDGEQSGRQFPAGTWSIDFLAVDRRKNELVVIELKRGQTSDATVGQVLRYMNWVKENVAAENQNVRGIIVASDIDDALRYAARGLANVSVKTYHVEFTLQSSDL